MSDCVSGALVEIGELHVNGCVVDGRVGAAAGGHERVSHAGQCANLLGDAFGEGGGGRERSAFRSAHQNVELRLVVFGQEVLPDKHEQRHDADDGERAEGQHDVAMRQRPLQHAGVKDIDPMEEARNPSMNARLAFAHRAPAV